MYYSPHCTVNRLVAMEIVVSYAFAGLGEVDNLMSVVYSTTLHCLKI